MHSSFSLRIIYALGFYISCLKKAYRFLSLQEKFVLYVYNLLDTMSLSLLLFLGILGLELAGVGSV